jgi:hypothetical protein
VDIDVVPVELVVSFRDAFGCRLVAVEVLTGEELLLRREPRCSRGG